ncbi:MAG TPA: DUF2252 family protein, partial [Chloroflexota bacterium]|nr:DUF2252 family protein [Chloroflexota bacterium]
QDYERWLGERLTLVRDDLALKHEQMRADEFAFLRATFYRWAQLFPQVRADLARAPRTLAVGDLHVENFGTWRDSDGRLAWGVNDFDEASTLPYTNDLVRLAVSAKLAIEANHLTIAFPDACDAILHGYVEYLSAGGQPFVLAEEHAWLRSLAVSDLRDPAQSGAN